MSMQQAKKPKMQIANGTSVDVNITPHSDWFQRKKKRQGCLSTLSAEDNTLSIPANIGEHFK